MSITSVVRVIRESVGRVSAEVCRAIDGLMADLRTALGQVQLPAGFWFVCAGSPIAEETMKWHLPRSGYFLAVYEVFVQGVPIMPKTSVLEGIMFLVAFGIQKVFLHEYAFKMSTWGGHDALWKRMVLHGAWNAGVLLYLNPTAVSGNACVASATWPGHSYWRVLMLLAFVLYVFPYKKVIELKGITGHLREVLFSQLCRATGRVPGFNGAGLRRWFQREPLAKYPLSTKHSHPKSAAERASAKWLAELAAVQSNLPLYSYQASKRETDSSGGYFRTYHWVKDLVVNPSKDLWNDLPQNESLISVIDVDYYVDMPSFLTRCNGPVLLYHFSPTAVAYNGEEFDFTFDANNVVSMRISGNAVYEHKVWNFGIDTFSVIDYWWGLPIRATTYAVERKGTENLHGLPHHEIVLLIPEMHFDSILGAWFCSLLGSPELRHLNVHWRDEWALLDIRKVDKRYRSLGKINQHCHVEMPVDIFDALKAQAKCSSLKLTGGSVSSSLARMCGEGEVDGSAAGMVADFINEENARTYGGKPDVVVELNMAVQSYNYDGTPQADGDKESLRSYANPIVANACYAPLLNASNEDAAVTERVTKLLNYANCTPEMERMIALFCKLLIPNKLVGRGEPVDWEVLLEKQDRPSQRRIIDQAEFRERGRIVTIFIKPEAYSESKPPRVISQMDGKTKVDYSMFMYDLYSVFYSTHWYAFGKTPDMIANAVANVCSRERMLNSRGMTTVMSVVETDLSRFDGRVSPVLRALEWKVLERHFAPKWHADLKDLHERQFNCTGFTPSGITYKTGYSRASGSPETALFNSLANAFMAFLALYPVDANGYCRLTQRESEWIYENLGIYGGDDGLTPNANPDKYVRACESVGQVLKAVQRKPGERVTFLARVYGPDIWWSRDKIDMSSCCDIKRQLDKFHATPDKQTPPVMKFLEKMKTIELCDPNTPVFKEILKALRRILESNGNLEMFTKDVTGDGWWAKFDESCQFPNYGGDWMWDYLDECYPGFEYDRLVRHCETSTSLVELMKFPVCFEYERTVEPAVPKISPPVAPATVDMNNQQQQNEPASTTGVKRCSVCKNTGHVRNACPSRLARRNRSPSSSPRSSGTDSSSEAESAPAKPAAAIAKPSATPAPSSAPEPAAGKAKASAGLAKPAASKAKAAGRRVVKARAANAGTVGKAPAKATAKPAASGAGEAPGASPASTA